MRPQLSRHKTENREIFIREHVSDVNEYKEELAEGQFYKQDMERISKFITEITENEKLSLKDKESILAQLKENLCSLQREYERNVGDTLQNIEDSMKERIEEIKDATKNRERDVYEMENAMWETNAVDKKKLVNATRELHEEYCALLENVKEDLDGLMKEAKIQRTYIMEHRKKR